MNRTLKFILIFVAVDILAVGAYFGLKSVSGKGGKNPADAYPWISVDETYAPQNSIEEFIKADAVQKGLLPVQLRNYGRNVSILKKFRGTNFAGANETILAMTYAGLDDWMLIDIKYKNEKARDVARTILYVQVRGQWKVADSGGLMK